MMDRQEHIARMNRQRLIDVREALMRNHGTGALARKWGISRPGATQWCARHISDDDRKRLSDNGTATIGERRRRFDLVSRLELIALCRRNGWRDATIAAAIGDSPAAISHFLQIHAPDGLDAALADFREDEPTEQAA